MDFLEVSGENATLEYMKKVKTKEFRYHFSTSSIPVNVQGAFTSNAHWPLTKIPWSGYDCYSHGAGKKLEVQKG